MTRKLVWPSFDATGRPYPAEVGDRVCLVRPPWGNEHCIIAQSTSGESFHSDLGFAVVTARTNDADLLLKGDDGVLYRISGPRLGWSDFNSFQMSTGRSPYFEELLLPKEQQSDERVTHERIRGALERTLAWQPSMLMDKDGVIRGEAPVPALTEAVRALQECSWALSQCIVSAEMERPPIELGSSIGRVREGLARLERALQRAEKLVGR